MRVSATPPAPPNPDPIPPGGGVTKSVKERRIS